MEQKTDRYFREVLAGHRKDPPPHLWQGIAEEMVPPSHTVNGRRSGRPRRWWWGIPVVLLLTGLVYFALIQHPRPDQPLLLPAGEASELKLHTHTFNMPLPSTQQEAAALTSPSDQDVFSGVQEVAGGIHPVAESTAPAAVLSTHTALSSSLKETTASDEEQILQKQHYKESLTELQSEPPPSTQKETNDHAPGKPALQDTEVRTATLDSSSEEKAEHPSDGEQEQTVSSSGTADEPSGTPSQPIERPSATQKQQLAGRFFGELQRSLLWQSGVELYTREESLSGKQHPVVESDLLYRMAYRRWSLGVGVGWGALNTRLPGEVLTMQIDTVGYFQYVSNVNFEPVYNPDDSSVVDYTITNIISSSYPQLDTTYLTLPGEYRYRVAWLRIPVIAGYELYHTSRVSLSLQTGMIYHRQMVERRTAERLPAHRPIVAVYEPELQMNSSFWQFHGSVNMRYELTHMWYTEGGVVFRRVLNHQNPQGEHQTGAGSLFISAALGLWF